LNKVMTFRVPLNVEKFLNGCTTLAFWRGARLLPLCRRFWKAFISMHYALCIQFSKHRAIVVYCPVKSSRRILLLLNVSKHWKFVLLSVNVTCYIDGQKNKHSVLNECNRILKYNMFLNILSKFLVN
jgi:hypothetical protein